MVMIGEVKIDFFLTSNQFQNQFGSFQHVYIITQENKRSQKN